MSSKKARRRERQQKQQEESSRRGKLSPVMLFMLGIGAAVVLIVVGSMVWGERAEPPYPGAVWSEAHGHWH